MKTTINNRPDDACCINSKLFILLLAAGAIVSCLPAGAQNEQPRASEPDYNAPWPEAKKKGSRKVKAAEQTTTTNSAPVQSSTAPEGQPNSAALDPMAEPSSIFQDDTKHQVSVSGDFLLGHGDVTLPLGFSLAASGSAPAGYEPKVVKAPRDADYFGGTLSYSYGQSWYFDFGYSRGNSSGKVDANLGPNFTPASAFTIDETGYQGYVRYVPKWLRVNRVSAYFRLGVSYVDSQMTDALVDPLVGFYKEDVKGTDLLGNVGFGVGYRLWTAGRFRLGLQAEAEGFYGVRTQDITEKFPNVPLTLPTATIDNTLYGGIGRGTVHMEYRLLKEGLFRIFADVGVAAKFTWINYPSAIGFAQESFNELLWGPYAKLGFSYSF